MASDVRQAEIRPEIIEWKERNAQSSGRPSLGPEALVALAAKKQRLIELLARNLRRGTIEPWEIAASLAMPLRLRQAKAQLLNLQAELRYEQAWNAFLDGEADVLESTLQRDRELAKESLYRSMTLERQLREARGTTTKLVVAFRDSVHSLQRVDAELEDGDGTYLLDPVFRGMYSVGRAVEELHSVARPRDGTPPRPIENF
jgi:hypothetical protein